MSENLNLFSSLIVPPAVASGQRGERVADHPIEPFHGVGSGLFARPAGDTEPSADDELLLLRSNIGRITDQLQELLQRGEAAAVVPRVLNRLTLLMREATTIPDLFATVVSEARSALRTDRVVVYTFDANWKGTVVAESVAREYPAAKGAEIADPCFADRYVKPYLKGRINATTDIYAAGLTECHLKQLEPYQVKANLVVPILANQQLFGLLIAHQCSGPRQWVEIEIDFFAQLALQLGYAIDQITVSAQQATSARHAQLLNQLARRMQQTNNLNEIYDAAVEDARMALNADRVIVYSFDEAWRGTVVAEAIGKGVKPSLGDLIHDPCFADRYVKYYQRGQISATTSIQEAGLTACHLQQLEAYGVKANLVVPILANRQLFGLLIAHQCSGPRHWQELDIDFLRQLGTQLGFALDQAEVQRQLTKTRRLEQSATVLINRMRQSLETDKIFSTATRELRQLLKLDRVGIYRFNPDWGGEFIAESVGIGFPALVGPEIKTIWDDTYLQETEGGRYKNNETATVNDVREVGHTQCHVDKLEEFGIRAYVIAPIFVRNELWGLLGAYQSSTTRNWEESETTLVTRIGEQLGAALTQSEFFQELQLKTQELRQNALRQEKAAYRAELLNQIVFNIRRSLRAEDVFAATVNNLQSSLKADRVIVFTFAEDWQGTVTAESVLPHYPKTLGIKIADPCFAETYVKLYQQGRVQATDDIYASLSECHVGELSPFEVKANLVAPILSNQKLHGLLIVHQCDAPRHWQEEEIEFVRQVALQVGFALDQSLALASAEAAKRAAEQLTQAQREQNEALQAQIRTFLNDIRGSFEGDLTVRARLFEGEMGTVADFFNATLENLQELTQEVQTATVSVSQMSRNSGAQVSAVADEGRRQMAAIMAVLSKIQAMTNSMQGMATSAQQAQQQVAQGGEVVANSDRAMNDMVRSIKTVQQTVDKTAKKVKRLGDASQNISRIVSLISDLARQTNILSLNASIEPQMSGGSQGFSAQGFNTIAGEVQSLAEQSTEAAREIEQIIAQIQTETAEAVAGMESSQQQVILSTQLVESSRRQLGQITTSSQQIQEIVEQIAQVALTEVAAANDLSQMMQEVAGIANQTVQQSDQLATSFDQLLGVTDNLQSSVAQFKVE